MFGAFHKLLFRADRGGGALQMRCRDLKAENAQLKERLHTHELTIADLQRSHARRVAEIQSLANKMVEVQSVVGTVLSTLSAVRDQLGRPQAVWVSPDGVRRSLHGCENLLRTILG